MEGRERALMRANISLGLLISTLKKHDLDAPLSLDDPHLKELIVQVWDSLQEAHATEALSSVTTFIDRAATEGIMLNPGSVRGLLTALRAIERKLHDVGAKHAQLPLV
jgi:hypothetical protein